jgi:uncharacterized protein with GYD domain
MPKFLMQASYTAEGLKGLQKDKASGRKAAINAAVEAAGGKVETLYYCFGDYDIVGIIDAPDNASVSAFANAAAATGLVKPVTTPLLTVEEVDRAIGIAPAYRAPGR